MIPETRYTGRTVEFVPRQNRPNMVLKAFRITEDEWAAVDARRQREGLNDSEAIRTALKEWASRKDGEK